MQESNNESNEVTAQIYFAIIPEWILDLPISSAAVRVYCCLRRYADNKTGECFPSRRTLARRAKISLRVLDRAIKELINHQAIVVTKRKNVKEEYTSNLYTVMSLGVGSKTTLGSAKQTARGSAKKAALTKANTNYSHSTRPINESNMSEKSAQRIYPLGLDTQAPPAPPTKDEMEVIVKEFTELAKTGSKSHQQTMSRLARRFAKQLKEM